MCATASRKKAKKQNKPVEKRSFDRQACRFRVSYSVLSPKQAAPFAQGVALTRNISDSGLSILIDQEILTPALMQIDFSVPARPFHMLTLAKVVQCRWSEEAQLYEAGLRFIGILSQEFKRVVLQCAETSEPHAETPEAPPQRGIAP